MSITVKVKTNIKHNGVEYKEGEFLTGDYESLIELGIAEISSPEETVPTTEEVEETKTDESTDEETDDEEVEEETTTEEVVDPEVKDEDTGELL